MPYRVRGANLRAGDQFKRGINLSKYPHAQRWFDAINSRPAVQRALQVLSEVKDAATHDEKSRDILFGKTQFARR